MSASDGSARDAPPAASRPGDAPPDNRGPPPSDGSSRPDDVRVLARRILLEALRDPRQAHAPNQEKSARGVRELCDVAHARGLRAEQLIIVIKEVWHGLPGVRSTAWDPRTPLSGVITLCIGEYYAPRRRS